MKILITGATGFIGARLLAQAAERFGRDNVIALASRPVEGYRRVVYRDHDLSGLDASGLAGVDTVIHAGAFTPKNAQAGNDIAGCNANITFTTRLMGLPFDSLQRVIYLSTLDVYAEAALISESTPVAPATLYGLSKVYGERVVEIAGRDRGFEVQVLRIGHVYGPGEEKYQKMLPLTLRNVAQGKPVEIYGDGEELRSFIYIDDVVTAVLNATTLTPVRGPINIVGGTPISIRALVEKIVAMAPGPVPVHHRESGHVRRNFVFDNSLLRSTLLERETPLDIGLRAEFRHLAALLGQAS
jgi:UDP-glucose 4-epimerase